MGRSPSTSNSVEYRNGNRKGYPSPMGSSSSISGELRKVHLKLVRFSSIFSDFEQKL